jgi:hypothetical protein
MHCVIQTDDFAKSAEEAGLSEDEILAIETQLSMNPTLGELIVGTGGARKWRIPAKGKGKRGGGRVVSFFAADDVPVFLLEVFTKDEKINLSQAERNELRKILGDLAEDYRATTRRRIAQLRDTGTGRK